MAKVFIGKGTKIPGSTAYSRALLNKLRVAKQHLGVYLVVYPGDQEDILDIIFNLAAFGGIHTILIHPSCSFLPNITQWAEERNVMCQQIGKHDDGSLRDVVTESQRIVDEHSEAQEWIQNPDTDWPFKLNAILSKMKLPETIYLLNSWVSKLVNQINQDPWFAWCYQSYIGNMFKALLKRAQADPFVQQSLDNLQQSVSNITDDKIRNQLEKENNRSLAFLRQITLAGICSEATGKFFRPSNGFFKVGSEGSVPFPGFNNRKFLKALRLCKAGNAMFTWVELLEKAVLFYAEQEASEECELAEKVIYSFIKYHPKYFRHLVDLRGDEVADQLLRINAKFGLFRDSSVGGFVTLPKEFIGNILIKAINKAAKGLSLSSDLIKNATGFKADGFQGEDSPEDQRSFIAQWDILTMPESELCEKYEEELDKVGRYACELCYTIYKDQDPFVPESNVCTICCQKACHLDPRRRVTSKKFRHPWTQQLISVEDFDRFGTMHRRVLDFLGCQQNLLRKEDEDTLNNKTVMFCCTCGKVMYGPPMGCQALPVFGRDLGKFSHLVGGEENKELADNEQFFLRENWTDEMTEEIEDRVKRLIFGEAPALECQECTRPVLGEYMRFCTGCCAPLEFDTRDGYRACMKMHCTCHAFTCIHCGGKLDPDSPYDHPCFRLIKDAWFYHGGQPRHGDIDVAWDGPVLDDLRNLPEDQKKARLEEFLEEHQKHYSEWVAKIEAYYRTQNGGNELP